jgi:cytidylate kinase
MSIIVLSSDSFCRGDEIAGRVARALDYNYIGPECVDSAAATYNVSAERLRRTLDPASSPIMMRRRSQERQIAYFQATLISSIVAGRVIYAGHAGHLLVGDVSHIVRVRLTDELQARAARRAAHDGITSVQAHGLIAKSDAQRKHWFMKVFGVDGTDPSLFDLVVDLSKTGVDGACTQIGKTARETRFRPVTYSIKRLRDHELACRVKARLIRRFGSIEVSARDGNVAIRSKAINKDNIRRADSIRRMLSEVEGVGYVVFE